MKKKLIPTATLALLTLTLTALAQTVTKEAPQVQATNLSIANPAIDYPGFLATAQQVQGIREARRVLEEDFIKMAEEEGTLILDARSADKYALLHVEGAINLPLTDFTEASLARVIPSKKTRILIYCNNNFDQDEVAFARKRIVTSLNLYTFNSLHAYGYENVYELGPLLDVNTTKLRLVGTRAATYVNPLLP